LQACAVVGKLTNPVEDKINNLFANCVMSAREIIRSIFLTRYQLLWMKKLPVGTRADLVHDGWLQIDHHAARHMFSCTRLREEGVERIIAAADGLVAWHLAIRLNAVLQAEELPARIADLDASLADVKTESLTHLDCIKF
jgi:hypothetical protein